MSHTGYEREARLAMANEAAVLVNGGLRWTEAAARLNIKVTTLDNLLKLQNLVPPLRALLAAEILPLTVAYALADLHPESQSVAWKAIKGAKNRAVALRKHLDEVASS